MFKYVIAYDKNINIIQANVLKPFVLYHANFCHACLLNSGNRKMKHAKNEYFKQFIVDREIK